MTLHRSKPGQIWMRTALTLMLAGIFLSACGERKTAPPASPQTKVETGTPALNEEMAEQLAAEAYEFGFPLVLMDITRAVMTSVPSPMDKRAPVNQFAHLREFPNPSFTDVVSPNVDTLYSSAWLDLSKQPMLLTVPEAGKRYYLLPLLDAWTNVFASPGPRTTGTGKQTFAIVGPDWRGQLPDGVQPIKSPTNMVWLLGRTQTDGQKDYASAHAFQDQLKLIPFGAWGNTYVPPENVPVTADVNTDTPPPEQVLKMDAATFFKRLNTLMKENPPAPEDAPLMQRLEAVGIGPGQPFELDKMQQPIAAAIERGFAAGKQKLLEDSKKPHGHDVNGWLMMTSTGTYGTEYGWRAIVALIGLGANLPQDAVYPRATTDGQGQPLNGAGNYMIRFPKDGLPPVNAFWSVTMYNEKQLLVQNPIARYALGDRDKLKFDKDGVLTLYIQRNSPGKDKESNWLPAPEGPFNVILRMYWPKPEVLQGNWQIPPIEPVQ